MNNIQPQKNELQAIVLTPTFDTTIQAYELALEIIRHGELDIKVGLITKGESLQDPMGSYHSIIGTTAEVLSTWTQQEQNNSIKEIYLDDCDTMIMRQKANQLLKKIIEDASPNAHERSCRIICVSSIYSKRIVDQIKNYGQLLEIKTPIGSSFNGNVKHIFMETIDVNVKYFVINEILANLKHSPTAQGIIFCQVCKMYTIVSKL